MTGGQHAERPAGSKVCLRRRDAVLTERTSTLDFHGLARAKPADDGADGAADRLGAGEARSSRVSNSLFCPGCEGGAPPRGVSDDLVARDRRNNASAEPASTSSRMKFGSRS
jgi:hypothetical protein